MPSVSLHEPVLPGAAPSRRLKRSSGKIKNTVTLWG
jgi:hypothetical protein